VDFYYIKNIAGRRLVGLRWWNEVNHQTGETHWVFESADPESRSINATDKRFFWIALYAQPALWIVMGVVAIIKIITFINLTPLWLTLVGMMPIRLCAGLADLQQPSLWRLLLQTRSPFRGATNSVKRAALRPGPSTAVDWLTLLRLAFWVGSLGGGAKLLYVVMYIMENQCLCW
jgi:hypothetical protein